MSLRDIETCKQKDGGVKCPIVYIKFCGTLFPQLVDCGWMQEEVSLVLGLVGMKPLDSMSNHRGCIFYLEFVRDITINYAISRGVIFYARNVTSTLTGLPFL